MILRRRYRPHDLPLPGLDVESSAYRESEYKGAHCQNDEHSLVRLTIENGKNNSDYSEDSNDGESEWAQELALGRISQNSFIIGRNVSHFPTTLGPMDAHCVTRLQRLGGNSFDTIVNRLNTRTAEGYFNVFITVEEAFAARRYSPHAAMIHQNGIGKFSPTRLNEDHTSAPLPEALRTGFVDDEHYPQDPTP